MTRRRSSFTRRFVLTFVALAAAAIATAQPAATPPPAPPAPPVRAFSALEFAPDGTLFVGDARAGAVLAIELEPRTAPSTEAELPRVELNDLETQIGALIGARSSDVVVHDLAVDPISFDIFLAISRNRGLWKSRWTQPNDLGDASELVRIDAKGQLHGVELADRKWTRTELPKPVTQTKHPFKDDVDLRTEAITDLAWDDGTLWVAGLSNQEFSSAIWRVPYPFPASPATITTVENYHVAHEKWETEAPVRALAAIVLGGKKHLVAAYLCTPLVVFETESLRDGAHVRGKTVAEFGSGNYPLDLELVATSKGPRLFLANHNLPLLIVDPEEVAKAPAMIAPEATYASGVQAEYRSGSGMQQMDKRGEKQLIVVRRLPSGNLALETWSVAR